MQIALSSSSLSFIATVQVENRIVIPPDITDLLKIKPKDRVEATVRKVVRE